MKSPTEKEKKLNDALAELKNLDLGNNALQKDIENLSSQKNQLEIEKRESLEQRKQIEFTEKIDELNQETDTLLEEIDKWQM